MKKKGQQELFTNEKGCKKCLIDVGMFASWNSFASVLFALLLWGLLG